MKQTESSCSRILVLGDGGWGTALAITLTQAGHDVRLWGYEPEYTAEMARSRRNPKFLPDVELPASLTISSAAGELARDCDFVFSVIPTQFLRHTLPSLANALPGELPVVSCTKGIEKGTLALPSQIIGEVLGQDRVIVLSGPSHAEELSRHLPTTVVIASNDLDDARLVQTLFGHGALRAYTGQDVIGVELGGAVKNVIAIAAGISDGLGFGDNSRAAIVTRGLVEITRLGLALGARRETFSGLSGIGDLIATCTSHHSRNWTVGSRLGSGEKLADILRSSSKVAEGVETSRSLHELNQRARVDMPISREVYRVLHEGAEPRDAVARLMSRSAKDEMEDLV